jgi:hypothetical protein
MNRKLGDEDRRAVDMLLNRARAGSAIGAFANPVHVAPARLESVGKILSLLERMPATEPPVDLAGKTLRHIDAAIAALTHGPIGQGPSSVPHLGSNVDTRPQA